MIHPDVQEALVEAIGELVAPDHVYSQLQPEFTSTLPAVLVRAEQNDGDALATHRVALEFYHDEIPRCRNMARTLLAHLTAGPHMTEAGLIDDVRLETSLREVPYTEKTVMFTASVFVDTRAI